MISSPTLEPAGWPRRVTLLGSTGFIGRSALDVIDRLPERLQVFGLGARSNVELLARQIEQHRPQVVALADQALEGELRSRIGGRWRGTLLLGEEGVEQLAAATEPDVVLNGLVGASGMRPTWLALQAGKIVALANKESLVIAGELLMAHARRYGGVLLPVDSEHNGLFQCLDGRPPGEVSRIILTASGGPFRCRSLSSFDSITPEEALRHPTWTMGPRITIDSATLLNKGFEVCEARWLFGMDPERIEVWIHPQSVVHGLVEWQDGSTLAQMSVPDMRIPIQFALCYPHRFDGQHRRCDLSSYGSLDFSLPEPERYPCLALARRALGEGGSAAAVLNAADEVLIQAFLDRRISFPAIATGLARVLDRRPAGPATNLEAVLEADHWAREEATRIVETAS